jgi:hypothetical protein
MRDSWWTRWRCRKHLSEFLWFSPANHNCTDLSPPSDRLHTVAFHRHSLNLVTEQDAVAVQFQTHTREVLGSKFGRDTAILTELFRGFSSLSRQIDGLRAGRQGFEFRPRQDFSLPRNVQTVSVIYPASYSMGTGRDFPRVKVAWAWSWPLTSM